MSREIKWSQWGPCGMINHGIADHKQLRIWLAELGRDAAERVKQNEKDHAIYGAAYHDDEGFLTEMRFYCDTFMTDEQLDAISRELSNTTTLYVAHKYRAFF